MDTNLAEDPILALTNFLFEMGYLKRMPRAGWILAGANCAESVGAHVFRTALIGFILALMEGANPWRTAVMCLIHDIPETRISDLHALSKSYINQNDAERRAIDELLRSIPGQLSSELSELLAEFHSVSPEAIVARDADVLECLYQAHEYVAEGFVGARHLIPSLIERLTLESSRTISKRAAVVDPNQWWIEQLATKKGTDV